MLRTLPLIFLCSFSLSAVAQTDKENFAGSPAMQTLLDDGEHTKRDIQEYKDLDQDGVPDKDDFCANTAKGTRVDKHGCELDSDGDGIYDKTDQCPNTPPGIPVNFLGCEGDEDKDGVVDSKDKCPGTPLGTKVNKFGCAINNDKDGDGVIDSLDQCPNTPKGYIVNKFGCPPQTKVTIEVTFPSGSWNVPTDQKTALEQGASKLKTLQPDEAVLISGFTDSLGKAESNLKLSWERANSVKNYILENFNYPKDKFYIIGQGASHPIATNKTNEGRKKNRRIEFEVVKLTKMPPDARQDIPSDMRLKK